VRTRLGPQLAEYAAEADAQPALTWPWSTVLHMAKAARVLAALKRDGWIESRRSGSHRVLAKGDQQRIWAYHDGVDLGGPAMARIARDYGYTLAELRKL
jgi:predicted RNA binding protein YcfA (HicA-like mRNA interferase family)